MSKKVMVLGVTGMLGSMVYNHLSGLGKFDVVGTVRDVDTKTLVRSKWGRDVEVSPAPILAAGQAIRKELEDVDVAINCIGRIKPYFNDYNGLIHNIAVNSTFPIYLSRAAEDTDTRIIQIATDCVYSGRDGNYTEEDLCDPTDDYGRSKALGEVVSPVVSHLRCSIIGPEVRARKSLLEWFLSSGTGATVNGYTNHSWNGITTLAFARICEGIIENDLQVGHMQHVIPNGAVTKYQMLCEFAKWYNRSDMVINKSEADVVVDRTLSTVSLFTNAKLWGGAGYDKIPTVPEMIKEMSKYEYFGDLD